VPIYYTYKRQVPLLPGQTLAFTAGKGYYAKGTPEPLSEHGQGQSPGTAKPAAIQPTPATPPLPGATPATPVDKPSPVRPSPIPAVPAPGATPTSPVDRPTIQATPIASKSSAPASQTISDAASSHGYGVRYYTYRQNVPLKSGQEIGFTRGQGYYAYYPVSQTRRPGIPATPHVSGIPTTSGTARRGGQGPPAAAAVGSAVQPSSSRNGRILASAMRTPRPPLAHTLEGVSEKRYVFAEVGGVAFIGTMQASATLTWSGGGKKPEVKLTAGGVSITDGPVTISDSTIALDLNQFFQSGGKRRGERRDRSRAVITVGLKGAGVRISAPGNVEFKVGPATEGGQPVLELEAAVTVREPLPNNGGSLAVTYAITIRLHPLTTTPEPPIIPLPKWLTDVLDEAKKKLAATAEVITEILEKVPPIEIELPGP